MFLTVLSLVLGVIGAIGGFQLIGKRLIRARVVAAQLAKISSSSHPKHRYTSSNWAGRIGADGGDWMIRWTATVRSEADRLEGIRIETRIDDLEAGSFVDSVEPSDMHVEEVAPTHPRNTARVLRFPRPLAGGEVQSFVYTRRFKKLKPLKSEDVFGVRPYAPTDKISMRLVFDGWMPDSVHYRETDRADSVLPEQERVIPDELTSEVRREIDSPSTSLTYGFFWQYNRHT